MDAAGHADRSVCMLRENRREMITHHIIPVPLSHPFAHDFTILGHGDTPHMGRVAALNGHRQIGPTGMDAHPDGPPQHVPFQLKPPHVYPSQRRKPGQSSPNWSSSLPTMCRVMSSTLSGRW